MPHAPALPRRPQSPEARVLGEALVTTINAHPKRYPAMGWAEVRAVLRVLEQAAGAKARCDGGDGE